ncbi:MAG: hypothetical protein LBH89_02745 [Lactococcus lactis]|jgi:hypothetical protein|nr:hypothetical protein [Lactococcus lactis]
MKVIEIYPGNELTVLIYEDRGKFIGASYTNFGKENEKLIHNYFNRSFVETREWAMETAEKGLTNDNPPGICCPNATGPTWEEMMSNDK